MEERKEKGDGGRIKTKRKIKGSKEMKDEN